MPSCRPPGWSTTTWWAASATARSASRLRLGSPAVHLVGLAGQEGHVAVHREPAAVAALQHEGGAPGPAEGPSVGRGGLGAPARRDPGRVAGGPDGGVRVEAEVADARPDLPPLLALDIVEPGDGGGEGAEGHRVGGEERAAGGEVARAHRGLEAADPVRDLDGGEGAHVGHYRRAPRLVNAGGSRYSLAMDPLTLETLAALARERGLSLSERELAGLLPLVETGRVAIGGLDALLARDDEPASHFHIL